MKTPKPIKRFLDLLFPPVCIGCGALLSEKETALCQGCAQMWEKEKQERCSVCGQAHFRCACRVLLPEIPKRNETFSLVGSQGLAQVHLSAYHPKRGGVSERAVLTAKDRALKARREWMGKELAERIGSVWDGNEPPILTFVPRKPSKVRQTGTDQAEEIAKGIGEEMGIDVCRVLSRHGGKDQKKKDKNSRFETSFHNYTIGKRQEMRVRGKDVWLCDDVWTTGASLLICAEKLMRAGARSVTAITLCRTSGTEEREESHEKNDH